MEVKSQKKQNNRRIDLVNGLFYIYKLTCRDNGKSYVGLTGHTPEARFRGHVNNASKQNRNQNALYNTIAKYGKHSFLIETVTTCIGLEKARELEKKYIEEFGTMTPNGMNLCLGGEGSWGHTVSEESRKIIGLKGIGRSWTPEQRKEREEMYARGEGTTRGQKYDEERKAELSRIHKERVAREIAEHGEPLNMVYLRKTHESNIGRPCQDHHKKRLSETNGGENNGMHGKNHSDDIKAKISEAAKDLANRSGIIVNGVTYASMNDCERKTGISVRRIQRMVKVGEATILYRTEPKVKAKKVSKPKVSTRIPVVVKGIEYATKKTAMKELRVSQKTLEKLIAGGEVTWQIPVTVEGVTYPSKAAACRSLNIDYAAVDRYLLTGCLDSTFHQVTIDGVTYRSMKDAMEKLGVDYYAIKRYETTGVFEAQSNKTSIRVGGVDYESLKDAEQATGISRKTLNQHARNGTKYFAGLWYEGVFYKSYTHLGNHLNLNHKTAKKRYKNSTEEVTIAAEYI